MRDSHGHCRCCICHRRCLERGNLDHRLLRSFGIGALLETTTQAGSFVLYRLMDLVKLALLGPTVAMVLTGLFVTYLSLRADEAPITTERLRAAMVEEPSASRPA